MEPRKRKLLNESAPVRFLVSILQHKMKTPLILIIFMVDMPKTKMVLDDQFIKTWLAAEIISCCISIIDDQRCTVISVVNHTNFTSTFNFFRVRQRSYWSTVVFKMDSGPAFIAFKSDEIHKIVKKGGSVQCILDLWILFNLKAGFWHAANAVSQSSQCSSDSQSL